MQFDCLRAGHRWGSLSWHELYIIAARQPPDWRFQTEVRGYEHWPVETEMLVQIAEHEAIHTWHRTGSVRARKPHPVERPWEKATHLSSAELAGPRGLFQNGTIGTPTDFYDARDRLRRLNGRAPDDTAAPVETDPVSAELERQLAEVHSTATRTADAIGYPLIT